MLWLDGVIMGRLFSLSHWLAACQGSKEHSAGDPCAQPLGVGNVHTQCAQASAHNTHLIDLQAYSSCLSLCQPLSHIAMKSFKQKKVTLGLDMIVSL